MNRIVVLTIYTISFICGIQFAINPIQLEIVKVFCFHFRMPAHFDSVEMLPSNHFLDSFCMPLYGLSLVCINKLMGFSIFHFIKLSCRTAFTILYL